MVLLIIKNTCNYLLKSQFFLQIMENIKCINYFIDKSFIQISNSVFDTNIKYCLNKKILIGGQMKKLIYSFLSFIFIFSFAFSSQAARELSLGCFEGYAEQ